MKPLKLIYADYRRVMEKYGDFVIPWPEFLAFGMLLLFAGFFIGFTLR